MATQKHIKKTGYVKDLSGQRFGSLVVMDFHAIAIFPSGHTYAQWRCKCDCGNEIIRSNKELRRTRRQRMCIACRKSRKGNTHPSYAHGKTKTQVWYCYHEMLRRCRDPRRPGFKNYGGRGIIICQAWQESFEAFYRDVGDPPTPHHSIDRIDNNGHYEPGNMRWTTKTEQARNTRRNRMLTYNGITASMSAWSEITGIHYSALRYRIYHGWPLEKALSPGRPRAKTICAG